MAIPGLNEKFSVKQYAVKSILLSMLLLVSIFVYRQATAKEVTLIVDYESQIIMTEAKTVGQLLDEIGIYVRGRDKLSPSADERIEKGMIISLRKAFPVFLHVDGQTALVYTTAESTSELLNELAVTVALEDRVEPSLQATLSHGSDILITRVSTSLISEEVSIPFKTEQKNDPTIPRGKKKVTVQGKVGTLLKTYEIVLADGNEESRQLIEEKQLNEPTNSVVLIGTADPEPIVTASARGGGVVTNIIEGIASWYGNGDGLHGAKTASGEVFNKNDYTAAHPTLAFGTRVRVTYLKTGKSVDVRINDRGPFGKNRIIDLSMAAAEAIGLRSAGVGKVTVEVLK
ncbi:MAG: septal ring lytic transglycosylase RlpA family protein [Clostridiales bacterium]|jgi:rare lipoprotein A (peptidoglycan hydrolase)|nr:septal ring lytic transglycosylase RlpA family protein [Clostridiales bacterium]